MHLLLWTGKMLVTKVVCWPTFLSRIFFLEQCFCLKKILVTFFDPNCLKNVVVGIFFGPNKI